MGGRGELGDGRGVVFGAGYPGCFPVCPYPAGYRVGLMGGGLVVSGAPTRFPNLRGGIEREACAGCGLPATLPTGVRRLHPQSTGPAWR